MREFNLRNWQETLARVFAKAVVDPVYRELCLSHPRQAVAEVSEIDLPVDFKFEFVDRKEDLFYSYALPPFQAEVTPDQARDINHVLNNIIGFLLHCTQPTTGL